MLKKLMITTAVSALMVGSAAAQATSPSPAPTSPPPAASPAPPAAAPAQRAPTAQQTPAMKSQDMARPLPGAQSGQATILSTQAPDQMLFSKFSGTDVIGGDNEKVGDISDVLFGKDGKIEAYVVRIGGFLGIGAKDVALAPTAFEIVPGDRARNESDKLRVSMTKEQLKDAATFKPRDEQRTTTGTGAATPPRTGTGTGSTR